MPEPPPFLADLEPPADAPLIVAPRMFGLLAYTAPWNLTGHPAISLPLHQTSEGLPIGVQLVAPHDREDLLIAVAAQLEQARPWADRWPPIT